MYFMNFTKICKFSRIVLMWGVNDRYKFNLLPLEFRWQLNLRKRWICILYEHYRTKLKQKWNSANIPYRVLIVSKAITNWFRSIILIVLAFCIEMKHIRWLNLLLLYILFLSFFALHIHIASHRLYICECHTSLDLQLKCANNQIPTSSPITTIKYNNKLFYSRRMPQSIMIADFCVFLFDHFH